MQRLTVLSQGNEVRVLHTFLEASGLEVAEDEARFGRFGLSTRKAVQAFQRENALPPTGEVTPATLAALRARAEPEDESGGTDRSLLSRLFGAVRRRGRSPVERLDMTADAFAGQDDEAALTVRRQMETFLKRSFLESLDQPSERMRTAVDDLKIDLDAVRNLPFDRMVRDHVLPELMEDEGLDRELFKHARRGLELPQRRIADVLGLDGDIRDSEPLEPVVARVRNAALAEMVGLDEDGAEALGEIDVADDDAALHRLVGAGTLTERQRDDLVAAAGLTRFTGDNFTLARALDARQAVTPRDVARLRRIDWLALLRDHQIAAPRDESEDSYAELLERGAEFAAPSAYALARLADADLGSIAALDRVPQTEGPLFDDDALRADLDLSSLADRDAVEMQLDELNRLGNRHAALGVRDILNEPNVPTTEKRARIERRLAALQTAIEAQPDLDLSLADFSDAEDPTAIAFRADLSALDADERPHVRRALMAAQRVHRVTSRFDEADSLLAAGLDSAARIVDVGDSERLAALTGLAPHTARAIYNRSSETRARMALFLRGLEETTTHAMFGPVVLDEAGGQSTPLVNTLQRLPGYEELFGSQNYCTCRQCQSIFSPAAYFVDLMRFIESKISKPNFREAGQNDHPLNLRNRRPDLWSLPLTCENTDTMVMYLTIVNEVLTAYLDQQVPHDGDLFAFLATDARSSFQQPFNLPFAELLLYLDFLGVGLDEVAALFEQDGIAPPHARLGIAPRLLATIATPDFSTLEFRFGLSSGDNPARQDVAVMTRVMGVDREHLGRLLSRAFVQGDLGHRFVLDSPDGLSAFTEHVEILDGASLADEAAALGLLDRLHRFTRLQWAVGWTPEEVDLALAVFTGGTIDAPARPVLADLTDVAAELGLSLEELVAICDAVPVTSTAPDAPALATVLFGDATSLQVRHPALANNTDDEVSIGFGALQGALRIDEPDLVAMLQRLVPDPVLSGGTIGEPHLSALYAASLLGRALGIEQSTLARLEDAVPALRDRASASAMLGALTTVLAMKRAAAAAERSLGELLVHVGITADDPAIAVRTAETLGLLRDTLADDLRLRLVSGDLSRIAGITSEAAHGVMEALAARAEPWLAPANDGTEAVRLTGAVSRPPDVDVLQAVLSAPGGPLDGAAAGDPRADTLVAAVVQEISRHHPATLIEEALAEHLGTSGTHLDALQPLLSHLPSALEPGSGLAEWLSSADGQVPDALSAHIAELIRLTDLFVGMLSAPASVVEGVAATADSFSIVPGEAWSFDALANIAVVAHLSATSEADVGAVLRTWNSGAFADDAIADLAVLFGIETIQVVALLAELAPSETPFAALRRFGEGARIARATGLDPAALRQLGALSYEEIAIARDLVRGAMRAKYPDESGWQSVIGPFDAKTEGFKRDALVDRILSRPLLGFRTARDIYHFFLLDPQMEGCFRTSRVKNAIGTCQLYVQRCLMGIEKSQQTEIVDALTVRVSGGAKTRRMWDGWMKFYRMWEANRKVFLYPENYLSPDLQIGGSHILDVAQETLEQGDLSPAHIERVYADYLAEFAVIGALEVVDVLYEGKDAYLMIGRTRTEPYGFFLRRYHGKNGWEPWQPIDLDIGARAVSALRKGGRLMLFWSNVALDAEADRVQEAQPEPDLAPELDTDDSPVAPKLLPVRVSYASLDASGAWSTPQDALFYSLILAEGGLPRHSLAWLSDRLYVDSPHTAVHAARVLDLVRIVHGVETPAGGLKTFTGFLNESDASILNADGLPYAPNGVSTTLPKRNKYKRAAVILDPEQGTGGQISESNAPRRRSLAYTDFQLNRGDAQATSLPILTFAELDRGTTRLRAVRHQPVDLLLSSERWQFLLKRRRNPSGGGFTPGSPVMTTGVGETAEIADMVANAKWELVRLDGWRPSELAQAFHKKGLESILSPERQRMTEPTSHEKGIEFHWGGRILPSREDGMGTQTRQYAEFEGVHGTYLWELHFHLPFMIAHRLNANGKYRDADRVFRQIFDPHAPADEHKAHWRFIAFRGLSQPRLRAILTQKAAIKAYQNDPYNPYRIASLRQSAFMKAVVMHYIDNLLDWGDDLFERDTRESINEAMLLYIMAADILGERPAVAGECDVADSMTYNDILLRGRGNTFLVELENIVMGYQWVESVTPVEPMVPDFEFVPFHVPGTEPEPDPASPFPADVGLVTPSVDAPAPDPGVGLRALASRPARYVPLESIMALRAYDRSAAAGLAPALELGIEDVSEPPDLPDPSPPDPVGSIFEVMGLNDDVPDPSPFDGRQLGFCAPPNEILLGYWDRVEDRLYKLRNCMNIKGIVRELPLFAPPIDPALLVRARAAGIALEDLQSLLDDEPPHHRFDVLLERARRFATTAQEFGNRLQAALERKDESELILLRSVHEDLILDLVRSQRQAAIDEAAEARAHLDDVEQEISVRIDFYSQQRLGAPLDTVGKKGAFDALAGFVGPGFSSLGLNAKELLSLTRRANAILRRDEEAAAQSKAHKTRENGPQWSVGTEGAVGGTLPPVLYARASTSATYGSSNVDARYQRQAFRHQAAAGRFSQQADLLAGVAAYERRYQDWNLQLGIAQRQLVALEQQKVIADARVAIARKDLEVHEAQQRNAREIYDFAKDRFTNLGLYTYLSTTLSRLYREANDMALKMARLAERAYRFEIGDDAFFIGFDNWTASRAGLLAADRLLLQLMAMEAAYGERDRRRQEVTLPCPLSEIDPDALIRLQRDGTTSFTITDTWANLYYPGEYKRLIEAVRLSVHCVTGPYGNVAARLTLTDSAIRANTDPDAPLLPLQVGRNASITASTAISDAGVFAFQFGGARHLPFKGAGQHSTWQLQLPSMNRTLDYATISDVILEISYTAEYDGVLRRSIEGADGQPGEMDLVLGAGIPRIIGLAREFPEAFFQLTNAANTDPVTITLDPRRLLPHWLARKSLGVASFQFLLQPDGEVAPDAGSLNAAITMNGTTVTSWSAPEALGGLPTAQIVTQIDLSDPPPELQLSLALPDDLVLSDLLLRVVLVAE
ncbi:MAG: neuraminidase-like domain-containing protein [Pseudomonadota bacterium]